MKPSRRHESLIPLSRQHHYALMLCLRIRQGLHLHSGNETWIRSKAAQAAKFFESDLADHFKAEEEALFLAMQQLAGASELLSELVSEHRAIEHFAERFGRAEVAGLAGELIDFAHLLEAHIRKEERQLFPLYEKQAGAELSEEVGRAIRNIVGDAMQPGDPALIS